MLCPGRQCPVQIQMSGIYDHFGSHDIKTLLRFITLVNRPQSMANRTLSNILLFTRNKSEINVVTQKSEIKCDNCIFHSYELLFKVIAEQMCLFILVKVYFWPPHLWCRDQDLNKLKLILSRYRSAVTKLIRKIDAAKQDTDFDLEELTTKFDNLLQKQKLLNNLNEQIINLV